MFSANFRDWLQMLKVYSKTATIRHFYGMVLAMHFCFFIKINLNRFSKAKNARSLGISINYPSLFASSSVLPTIWKDKNYKHNSALCVLNYSHIMVIPRLYPQQWIVSTIVLCDRIKFRLDSLLLSSYSLLIEQIYHNSILGNREQSLGVPGWMNIPDNLVCVISYKNTQLVQIFF